MKNPIIQLKDYIIKGLVKINSLLWALNRRKQANKKFKKEKKATKKDIVRKQCPTCNHSKARVYSDFYKCTKCLNEFTDRDLKQSETT